MTELNILNPLKMQDVNGIGDDKWVKEEDEDKDEKAEEGDEGDEEEETTDDDDEKDYLE